MTGPLRSCPALPGQPVRNALARIGPSWAPCRRPPRLPVLGGETSLQHGWLPAAPPGAPGRVGGFDAATTEEGAAAVAVAAAAAAAATPPQPGGAAVAGGHDSSLARRTRGSSPLYHTHIIIIYIYIYIYIYISRGLNGSWLGGLAAAERCAGGVLAALRAGGPGSCAAWDGGRRIDQPRRDLWI